MGEIESETLAGIFTKYQNEVPAEFKSLGTLARQEIRRNLLSEQDGNKGNSGQMDVDYRPEKNKPLKIIHGKFAAAIKNKGELYVQKK